jgi:ParB/RepB/Spo0J family partition protein
MTDFQLVNLDPKEIQLDPGTPNVRDRVKDTTDLQASIKEWGIQNPLEVRIEDDKFFLVGGHRRRTAALALGLEAVPCLIKDILPEDTKVLMLISDMQKPFPHIINDADGKVIGGRAFAVANLSRIGEFKKYQIAKMIGVTADVVGAYVALVEDCLEVRKRVENGDMDITVYSIIKRQTPEFTARLLKKKGRITANYVRKFKKRWPDLQKEMQKSEEDKKRQALFDEFTDGDGGDTGDIGDTFPEEEPEVEYVPALCINSAVEWLERLRGVKLEPSDQFLMRRLRRLIKELEIV